MDDRFDPDLADVCAVPASMGLASNVLTKKIAKADKVALQRILPMVMAPKANFNSATLRPKPELTFWPPGG
jgi:hypothetical protein